MVSYAQSNAKSDGNHWDRKKSYVTGYFRNSIPIFLGTTSLQAGNFYRLMGQIQEKLLIKFHYDPTDSTKL
jgi:hypothetical protein